ncbi:hypothetical protein UFOVP1083_10 [uncultured Caudovirales phage]|uniref:Uncharacterized protein n=1 Tax=uncultured Caudovirales phage TaxID=2100421 RepID=A0A6J5QP72_9CAUD|nr:hypothetical protein UFOVP1083_10 [uncultured Caudovirales phage]CAB4199454.1 hypothetical protein UFOVP1327_43 [uncultured Caudovirales phage]
MSNELVIAQPDYESLWKLSQRISNTPFVPTALRGKNEAVLACVLYGAELGLGPMQSLNSIHVIEGRTAMSPELMRAMVARHGHRIDVVENSAIACEVKGIRSDTGSTATVRWTMEDAKLAGLAGKNNWKTYPRAMLLARATSELCRIVFPDVIAGLSYTPEEVSSIAGVEYIEEVIEKPAAVIEQKVEEIDDEIIEAEIVEDEVVVETVVEEIKKTRNLKYIGGMAPVAEVAQELSKNPHVMKESGPAFDQRLAEAESWGKWPYVKAITSVAVKKLKRDNMPISFYELAHDEKLFYEVREAVLGKKQALI